MEYFVIFIVSFARITSSLITFTVLLWSVLPSTASERKINLPQQPQFELLNSAQQSDLIQRANKGDKQAQDQVIERNYWGFLEIPYQCSLWGEGGRNSARLNPLLWENIEDRAIENDQYCYALIDAYAHYLRWTYEAKVPFSIKFPRLVKVIQDKVEDGDPCAQFSLGVMYLQLDHQHAGLLNNVNKANLAFEIIKKAADQGHSLALTSLGKIDWSRGARGRNDVKALRWFLQSKNNKISQDVLRKDLLIYQRQTPCEVGTFHEHIESIKDILGFLLGEHSMQIGLHNNKSGFADNQFAIPKMPTLNKVVTDVEEEALAVLSSLQQCTPGFMVTGVMLKERRDREYMLSDQTQPAYVSVYEADKVEYLTVGDENVIISTKFLAYIAEIDGKFAKADTVLREDSESYQLRLNHHLSKLKEKRFVCLSYQQRCKEDPSQANTDKFAKHTKAFNKQKEKYEDIEPILTIAFQKIDEERKILASIKEAIKNIVPMSVGKRNREFFEEHPYLKQ